MFKQQIKLDDARGASSKNFFLQANVNRVPTDLENLELSGNLLLLKKFREFSENGRNQGKF